MPALLEIGLIAALGFLGSFGHCVGMCGPIAAAFSLAREREIDWRYQLWFHSLLNLGRLCSYVLVGAGIGALGSVLFAGGQMAGIGSPLRRGVAILTGCLLIWFGLAQVGLLPKVPLWHPLARQHQQLNQQMSRVAEQRRWWTPWLLGLLWGLIPCGFLYAAQLRAAETQTWLGGAVTMLAFGLGTLPAMLGVGVSTAFLSRDRRSQLFRLGGWVTLLIGLLILMRTGDTMSDYSGHAAIVCLALALVARPLSRLWAGPLRYRRGLGVGAFVLGWVHTLHMLEHTWRWRLAAVNFMLPTHQLGVWLGAVALLLMTPAALTSFDWAQRQLGRRWRRLHLLGVPAFVLVAAHMILVGSHYWGSLALTWQNHAQVAAVSGLVMTVLAVRSRCVWQWLSQDEHYAKPISTTSRSTAERCCTQPAEQPRPGSQS
ncbi:MAG: sulfite exporter TauE/SafE family protein [Leptolyngbya sp. SIO4C1]|nr:sulfite exporter TauE/SafE family protein [Leptolyngbya sp. SIO4C1]